MDADQISTLLEPFLSEPLSPAQLAHISTYIDLLLRWNARTNLTAIRAPEEIVTRHFGESIFAAQTLFRNTDDPERGLGTIPPLHSAKQDLLPSSRAPDRSSIDLIDVGSGAGFPGLAIHLATPNLRSTLIESQQKKVAFLREAIRALTLTNINVSPGRAEDFPARASTVTLRAVERFDEILPIVARLLAPGGRLGLLISAPQESRARAALPELNWQPAIPIPESSTRILLLGWAVTALSNSG
jgi:16S rRNA (guanine527-N7)-methyltransferase